jgi:invasion protein IalB
VQDAAVAEIEAELGRFGTVAAVVGTAVAGGEQQQNMEPRAEKEAGSWAQRCQKEEVLQKDFETS